jgi:hypothetical protein
MIFISGTRLMGRIEELDGTFIATRFLHVNYVPLVPLRSYLVLESDIGQPARPVGAAAIRRSVEIALHPISVFAGYARVWGAMGAIFFVVGAVVSARGPGLAIFLALAILTAGIATWSWTKLGRLSSDSIERRRAYAALTREIVDPALLCRNNEAFCRSLRANVVEGAKGVMGMGYRTALDPEREWAQIALDPTVRDPAFLQACLTLARIEWARTRGAVRVTLASQHDQIWEKLKSLAHPGLESRPA